MKEEISKKLNQILLKRTGIDFQKQEELQTEDFFGGKIKRKKEVKYMQKRLGKKVYRKMPTMQVLAGCACISLCNASGSSMSKMLSIMIAP